MKDKIYTYIGAKIKELRIHFAGGKGLKQEELAGKMKVSPNTISRWETGIYKPRIEDLNKLANFFSVPIYTFLPADYHPDKPELNALFSATADLKKEDIEELTRFALFRKARNVLHHKKKGIK